MKVLMTAALVWGSLAAGAAHAQFTPEPDSQPEHAIGASVLPSARAIATTPGVSVRYSAAVSDVATSGSGPQNCTVTLPGMAGSFQFQTTDSNGNLTGVANTPFSVPAGGSQSLQLTYYPVSTTLSGQVLAFDFDCSNRAPAAVIHGVSVAYLTTSPSTSPTPDLIASLTAANPSAAGGLKLDANTGDGFMSAAVQNIGAAGTITIEAMSPEAFLQLTSAPQNEIDAASDLNGASFSVCRYYYGNCVHVPQMTVDTATFVNNWAIFDVRVYGAQAPLVHAPGYNRAYLVFRESGTGRLLGAASLPVCSGTLPRC